MAVSHVKSNPVANMTGTVTVFNSAGVTTTVAATDLVRPTDWNSAHNQFITLGGNTLGASTISGTNIEFHGAGNVSLSGNGNTLVIAANAQTVQTQNMVSLQGSTGAIVFSNSNGITFGGNASTITASHNGLTTARASNDAIGLNTALTANGVAWTVNSSGLSLNVPAFLTTAAQSNHSHGNPTLALTNLSGTTASNSAGLTLSLSAAAPGGGGGPALSAGGASASNGTIVFSNSNGVSFGMNGSTITATVEPGAAAGIAAVGAGTQQATSGTVTFVNSNGITFGMSGSSQITVSHNGITQQSTQPVAVSGQNGSYAFSTLSFSNANGISFGTSAGSAVTASYTVPTVTNSSWTVSDNATSGSVARLAFTNLNGITLSLSSGAGGSHTIVGSHNALTSQSNQAVSGSNGSFTFQTVTFGNLNGLSFYTSNGSLVGSHNALTTARASNDAIGLNTALTAGPLAWTVNSSGLSLNASSVAGTSSGFTGANISASITHNTAGLALSMSVAAPGAAAESNAFNLLGANTAGNTTATGSTIGLSGINMTLSGTNASQIVMSVPATSSLVAAADISISTNGSTITISRTQSTQSGWNPFADQLYVADQIGNASLRMEPMGYFPNVQYDRLLIPIFNSNSSNSSGSHTLSFWVGLYSRNGSTLSLASSTSASTALTHSGTAGSYSLYSGMRFLTIGSTNTINGGLWWIGFVSRSTSGGTNGTYSNMLVSGLATAFQGFFGSSNNTTQQWTLGQGIYTATTSGMPASVAFSELRGSDSILNRAPYILFASSTV